MSTFSFELKKILFSKRFIYTVLVLVAVITGVFVRNILFTDLVEEKEKEQVTTYTQEVQKYLSELKYYVDYEPDNEEKIELYKQLGAALNAIYEWDQTISSEDWRVTLTKKREFLSALLVYKENKGEFSIASSEIKRLIASAEHHLAVGIRPESEQYSTALPNFMKLVTSVYVNLGAIILLLLIVGDSLTSEFEQRSIQFLYTQPLKKGAIIHAKYGTALVVYVIVTALTYLLTWLLGMFFGKVGTFQYPVMFSNQDTYKFITISEYIQWSLIGMSVMIVMVIALNLFFSVMMKHTIVTLLVTLFLLVVGFFALQPITTNIINWVNPFAFTFAGMNVLKVDDLWVQSVPIIIILAVIFYMFTLFKIKRSY